MHACKYWINKQFQRSLVIGGISRARSPDNGFDLPRRLVYDAEGERTEE